MRTILAHSHSVTLKMFSGNSSEAEIRLQISLVRVFEGGRVGAEGEGGPPTRRVTYIQVHYVY